MLFHIRQISLVLPIETGLIFYLSNPTSTQTTISCGHIVASISPLYTHTYEHLCRRVSVLFSTSYIVPYAYVVLMRSVTLESINFLEQFNRSSCSKLHFIHTQLDYTMYTRFGHAHLAAFPRSSHIRPNTCGEWWRHSNPTWRLEKIASGNRPYLAASLLARGSAGVGRPCWFRWSGGRKPC